MKYKKLLVLSVFSLATTIPNIQLARPIISSTDDATQEKPFAYGYIYNKEITSYETAQALKIGEDVTFDAHGPIEGIQHQAGSSEIIFDNDGVYTINFLTVSNGNGAIYELFLNDKLIGGNPYGFFGKQDIVRYGQSIIKAKRGDKLSLRLYSVLRAQKPVSLNASIMIVQIA